MFFAGYLVYWINNYILLPIQITSAFSMSMKHEKKRKIDPVQGSSPAPTPAVNMPGFPSALASSSDDSVASQGQGQVGREFVRQYYTLLNEVHIHEYICLFLTVPCFLQTFSLRRLCICTDSTPRTPALCTAALGTMRWCLGSRRSTRRS